MICRKNIRADEAIRPLAIPKRENLVLGCEEVEKPCDSSSQHALGDVRRTGKRDHETRGLIADGMRVQVMQTGDDPLARSFDNLAREVRR